MTGKLKNSLFISAAAFAVLGLILILWPSVSGFILCHMIGIGAIVFGIFEIVKYIFKKSDAFVLIDYSLLMGITFFAVGIVFMTKASTIFSFIGLALGICILLDSILRLQFAINLFKFGNKSWIAVLVTAVLMIVAGIVIVCNPFSTAEVLFRVTGICMLIDALLSFGSTVYISKKLG